VRRGRDPGQAGLIKPHVALPAFHGHDRQITFCAFGEPALAVDHLRQLTAGHTVDIRDREEAHVRLVLEVERSPFDAVAGQGIGAIENHETQAVFGGRLHRIGHGTYIGV